MLKTLHLTRSDAYRIASGVLIAIACFLASAAYAHADTPDTQLVGDMLNQQPVAAMPGPDRLALFEQTATSVWGAGPCTGRYDIRFDDTALTADRDGQAFGLDFGDGIVHVNPSCRIDVRRDLTPYRECQIIVHEIGHDTPIVGDLQRDHASTGIMSAGALGGQPYEPCMRLFAPRLTTYDAQIALYPHLHGRDRVKCTRLTVASVSCRVAPTGRRARTAAPRDYTLTRTPTMTVRVQRPQVPSPRRVASGNPTHGGHR